MCSNLNNLTLYGNPICVKPSPDTPDENVTNCYSVAVFLSNELGYQDKINKHFKDATYNYRHTIIRALPQLKTLDDELTLSTKSVVYTLSPQKTRNNNTNNTNTSTHSQAAAAANSNNNNITQMECPFDNDWQLINEWIAEGVGPPEDKLAINESMRPGTTSSSNGSRINTSVRPLSAMRPLSSYKQRSPAGHSGGALLLLPQRERTATGGGSRQATGDPSRVSTTSNRSATMSSVVSGDDIVNDASGLTVGPTLQGNPLRSLMARRRGMGNNKSGQECNSDDSRPTTAHNITTQSPRSTNKKTTTPDVDAATAHNGETRPIDNKALSDELNAWRKEHAK